MVVTGDLGHEGDSVHAVAHVGDVADMGHGVVGTADGHLPGRVAVHLLAAISIHGLDVDRGEGAGAVDLGLHHLGVLVGGSRGGDLGLEPINDLVVDHDSGVVHAAGEVLVANVVVAIVGILYIGEGDGVVRGGHGDGHIVTADHALLEAAGVGGHSVHANVLGGRALLAGAKHKGRFGVGVGGVVERRVGPHVEVDVVDGVVDGVGEAEDLGASTLVEAEVEVVALGVLRRAANHLVDLVGLDSNHGLVVASGRLFRGGGAACGGPLADAEVLHEAVEDADIVGSGEERVVDRILALHADVELGHVAHGILDTVGVHLAVEKDAIDHHPGGGTVVHDGHVAPAVGEDASLPGHELAVLGGGLAVHVAHDLD
mmetsp:Transcript_37685/g.118930  ORF Transcript_37685/g.118930 Transcript_37685/m.118930 type:complete len:372 (-) Transcript_37685:4536-5651(-)